MPINSKSIQKQSQAIQSSFIKPEIFTSAVGVIKRVTSSKAHFYYCQVKHENFVYERPVGQGSLDDLSLFVTSAMFDKDRKAGAKVLLDLRWVTIDVNFTKMFEFARGLELKGLALGLETKTLVLLVNKEQSYGKTRMYESIGDKSHQTVYPVRELDSAVELLNVPSKIVKNVIAEVDRLETALT